MVPLSKSVRYRSFISQRDRALESLLQKTQFKISDVLRGTFTRVVVEIQGYYVRALSEKLFYQKIRDMKGLEAKIESHFQLAAHECGMIFQKLRRHAYLLAYAGEAEAIGRATGEPTRRHMSSTDLDEVFHSEIYGGGHVEERLAHIFKKLEDRLMSVVQLAVIRKDEPEKLGRALIRTFPQSKVVRKPRFVLKKVREAENFGTKEVPMSAGFIADDEWADLVKSYTDEFIPKSRGPESVFNIAVAGEDDDQMYGWELEQQVTQDFVYQVRQGQVDAANENGIKDFIWIAILDDKTDDCCEWRDGKTSSEIEELLRTTHKDDDCDGAIVPPAHFNCRCSLAPATDALPEKEPSNIGEFEEWINKATSG